MDISTININDLIIENNKLKNENKRLTYKLNKKEIVYDRTIRLNSRFNLTINLLKSFGYYSIAYGSFIRKCFESLTLVNKMKPSNLIGETKYSDINIIFDSMFFNHDKLIISNYFSNFFYNLDIHRILNNTHKLIFEDYTLKKIEHFLINNNDSENIPKVRLYFKSNYDYCCINVLAWKIKNYNDFSINSICLTANGFGAMPIRELPLSNRFLNILQDISHQKVKFIQNLRELQDMAFPKYGESLLRIDKCVYLKKIYDIICNRYLNVQMSDYILPNNFIQFEQKEECYITGCKPPYPKIKLVCSHYISFMAYRGILCNTDDRDSQAIRCPFCRHDLKIDFSNIEHLLEPESLFPETIKDYSNEVVISLTRTDLETSLPTLNTRINSEILNSL
jgi:hypothetical protein